MARTLVDVACSSPLPTTVIAGDAALRRGLVTPAELALAVARTRHRRGAAAARRALSFADRRSESAGESRARLILSAQGLPEPVLQIRIYDRAGVLVGRVDLGYPGLGVLIEFDGMVKYRKPLRPGQQPEEVVIAEKRREDLLRSLGYTVVRFVWSDLADPAAMAATVRAALEQGARTVRSVGWPAHGPRIPLSRRDRPDRSPSCWRHRPGPQRWQQHPLLRGITRGRCEVAAGVERPSPAQTLTLRTGPTNSRRPRPRPKSRAGP